MDTDENLDSDQPQLICHSPYYDSNKLISTLEKGKDEFSILSTNIQSINAKIYELQIFVEHLKTFDFQFSAICIQESWLSEGDDTSQIQLEGYKWISQGKSCSSKGGLIIYLQDKFDYTYKSRLTNYNAWEGQIIRITVLLLRLQWRYMS